LEHAAQATGGNMYWVGKAVGLVAFGSVIAHTAVLLVFQLGQPRIFFSMARDGLLPEAFAKVHPRFRTPHTTTILTGVVVGLFAAWLNFGFVIYIAYGAVHSRRTGRRLAENASAHDAETAWAGATMGALGLLILFGAMVVDIAARTRRAAEGGDPVNESFWN